MHEDRRIDAFDIFAVAHGAPPAFFHIPLQLNAERSVVPARIDAAVDFARRKDKSAALGQRHEVGHVLEISHHARCFGCLDAASGIRSFGAHNVWKSLADTESKSK